MPAMMPTRAILVIVLLLVITVARSRSALCEAPRFVWWEAEAPAATNFPAQSAFSPANFPSTRALLSGGDWLSIGEPRSGDEAFARYQVGVPADGTYSLWARKLWKHGPFRWRFGADEWQTCGADVELADSVDLAPKLCANWVFLGKVTLPKGAQSFELRLLAEPGQSQTAAFDCFLLTQQLFMPNGKLKPGERYGLADDGFFPYEPGIDPFGSDALLDLRGLNENAAGENGFVRRSVSGFVLGNGTPVRFWGVNAGRKNAAQPRETVDYLARRLAKLGVNMVRYHGPVFADRDRTAADPEVLDDLFYFVAAMKRQGIYTTISFYFPLWFDIRPDLGIPGYEDAANKAPFALLYFDPRMQQIYRGWARSLLTTTNPYTGLALGQDPAVAIAEIINEDTFFFWTFTKGNIPPVPWQRLERLYADWLKTRYGSLDAARGAWGKERLPEDDPSAGRMGLYDAWDMTSAGISAGGADKRTRVSDQVRFLAETQKGFYESTARYFRKDLGARNLISCSNWTVSDPALLDALERYTYTAGDVIDAHGYFEGPQKGEGAGYLVGVGHAFQSVAGATSPERLPLRFVQVEGRPQIVSEIGWTNPNRYRADATFLTSAYGSLQGIDGFFFFAVGGNFLSDGWIDKFPVGCPLTAGAFPAAALQYRRGDVEEAANAAYEVVSADDLYGLKGSSLATSAALDELRKADRGEAGEASVRFDPLTFYVGRVAREYGPRSHAPEIRDLSRYANAGARTIDSLTGELHWDYGRGLVRVNTPRSQGAAGFLAKAGRIELQDSAIECDNEYASIMVTALDDQPLATSKRILIQAVSEERPYGFRTDGDRITALGGPPLGVKRIAAKVWLRTRAPSDVRAIALDGNGYATSKRVVIRPDAATSSVEIALDPTSLYHVVERP
jgi:hypothetical protein